MAAMTRRTHGIHTNVVTAAAGGLTVLGLLASGGCMQQAQTAAAASAAQVAVAAVTSVTSAVGGQTAASTTPRRSSGIKVDGRGGFDASEAQQNVLKRAKYAQEHNNDIIKPYLPATRPTSQPAVQPALGRPVTGARAAGG